MDVICNSCRTEYEFEETLVSPHGTTVKCTQCGHLFKVERAAPSGTALGHADDSTQPLQTQSPGNSHWTVRTIDGSTRELSDLSALAELIHDGTFGRDDELSRTGQVWRRLGEIEELEADFIAADRRGPSRPRPQPNESRSDAPRQSEPWSSAVEPSTRAPVEPETQSAAQTAPDAHAANGRASAGVPTASRSAHDPELDSATPPDAAAAGAAWVEPSGHRDSSLSLAPVEALRPPGPREESRRRAWARLLASSAIAATVAFWLFSMPPSAATSRHDQHVEKVDPSARFVSTAERALSTHRVEQFEPALVEYIKALAFREHDPHILSAISRVYALWAEQMRTEVELDKELSSSTSQSQLDERLTQARTYVTRASHYAQLALKADPNAIEAQLAHSDAMRLMGDLPAARAALARALERRAQPSEDGQTHGAGEHGARSAEALRVSALLALAEPEANPQAALSLAQESVDADPSLLRARLLLARLLIAQGEHEPARAQLQAVHASDPKHPMGLRLKRLLAAKTRLTASGQGQQDQGDDTLAQAQADATELDGYLERGKAHLASNQLGPARRMFEHVLTERPDSAPAHAGLGQVAIARGRPLQAIDHFVAAALSGDGDALIALGDTYRRLGRQREALTAYQSYLQQNPDGPQLDAAKAQVARLEEQFASARKP